VYNNELGSDLEKSPILRDLEKKVEVELCNMFVLVPAVKPKQPIMLSGVNNTVEILYADDVNDNEAPSQILKSDPSFENTSRVKPGTCSLAFRPCGRNSRLNHLNCTSYAAPVGSRNPFSGTSGAHYIVSTQFKLKRPAGEAVVFSL
jgi:hypothetical protein